MHPVSTNKYEHKQGAMTMNGRFGIGEYDEVDEAYDESDEAYDESDEAYDEAAPRRPQRPQRPPVRTAPRQSAYRPRPNPAANANVVTQAQLQAALARVNSQIATNSNAIKTVDGRVRGLSSEQARITSSLRKEIAERKKQEEATRKEIQATKELAAFLPIIAKDNPLIGLLAVGGLGGGSPFGGGSGGDSSSNNGLMFAIVLSTLFKPSAP